MRLPSQKNKRTAIKVIAVVFGMFALAYASFPLYNLFCRVTGYGGQPVIAASENELPVGDKFYNVRFFWIKRSNRKRLGRSCYMVCSKKGFWWARYPRGF